MVNPEQKLPEETIAGQSPEDQELSQTPMGKILGRQSHYLIWAVILMSIGIVIYDWRSDHTFDPGLLGTILWVAFGVFAIEWGAKATANFADAMKQKFGGTGGK